jgi:hypothetical protein
MTQKLLTTILRSEPDFGSREGANVYYTKLYGVFGPEGTSVSFLDAFEEEAENDWSAVEAEVAKSGCTLANLDMVVIPSVNIESAGASCGHSSTKIHMCLEKYPDRDTNRGWA